LTSDPLSTEQNRRLREGVALFNRGEFFECHEVLEAAWLEAAGEDKVFLQGLIQVAVSFYHLRRGNFSGAGRLLRAALEKLAGPAACSRQLDADGLREALRPLLPSIEAGQASPETPAPEIRFVSST
jgi:predicted metal-dependent hydrolase